MSRIDALTGEQRERLAEFVERGKAMALCTRPAERARAARAIAGVYRLANLTAPAVIWLPCPLSAALAVRAYAARALTGSSNTDEIALLLNENVDSRFERTVTDRVLAEAESAARLAIELTGLPGTSLAPFDLLISTVIATGAAVRSAIELTSHAAADIVVNSEVWRAVNSEVSSAIHRPLYPLTELAVEATVLRLICSAIKREAFDSALHGLRNQALAAWRSRGRDLPKYPIFVASYYAGIPLFGGLLKPGYAAFADYFGEVLGVSVDTSYVELAKSCGFFWPLREVCFASERPCAIHFDDAGRPYFAYPSGWGFWHSSRPDPK